LSQFNAITQLPINVKNGQKWPKTIISILFSRLSISNNRSINNTIQISIALASSQFCQHLWSTFLPTSLCQTKKHDTKVNHKILIKLTLNRYQSTDLLSKLFSPDFDSFWFPTFFRISVWNCCLSTSTEFSSNFPDFLAW